MTRRPLRARAGILSAVMVSGLTLAVAREHLDTTSTIPEQAIGQVEDLIRKAQRKQGIPGLSAAVSVGGLRWSKGFGLADIEQNVPATEETVYRLASISKPITAVAAMRLAEEGLLDLDAPVQSYVKSFPEKQWPLTCRHLLSHLGGVRWYRGEEMTSTRHYSSVVEGLEMFGDDPLEVEPGTRFLYSSYGYNLLGAAMETAAGQSFTEILESLVFQSAGMRNTRADNLEAVIPNRARGYRKGPNGTVLNSKPADTSNKIPGGGLCGTAIDLIAFAEAFRRDELVGGDTRKMMTRSRKLRDGSPTGYGLGWHVARRGPEREVWHGGRQPQVTTMLYTRPESEVAVAILCNLEGVELLDLAKKIADCVESHVGAPALTNSR